ncbi:hypothetical protein [Enterococcus faecalis]|nr:hypothetical protein [Enterococcus faecalis]
MVVRKKYDYWGIEITTWNKTNVVAYVACGWINVNKVDTKRADT